MASHQSAVLMDFMSGPPEPLQIHICISSHCYYGANKGAELWVGRGRSPPGSTETLTPLKRSVNTRRVCKVRLNLFHHTHCAYLLFEPHFALKLCQLNCILTAVFSTFKLTWLSCKILVACRCEQSSRRTFRGRPCLLQRVCPACRQAAVAS